MTPEDRERMEKWIIENCGPHQYGERDENNVDLDFIRMNLELSPLERLRRGDRATTDALWIREHVRKH